MQFKNKVSMALSDWGKFENDEDYEFAFGTIDFLSNKRNSHSHIYSEEVIKEYAPSVINKWVIADYSEIEGDVTSHTETQKIVGIVPEQEVKYRYDEDGFLIASVDVVISKLYATDVYEVFKTNNKRAVSIELLLGFTKETEDIITGYGDKIVSGFNITGITILGLEYNPSVPNANIVLTQMSDESVRTMESEYVKYSDTKNVKSEDNTLSEILNKVTKIEEKLSKEEIMAKNKEVVKYAVSIGDDLWGKIYNVLKEKYPINDDGWIHSQYYIRGIYEEGTEKFVIVENDSDKKFKIMFTLTETEFELSDEITEVKVDFIPIEMEMFTSEDFVQYESKLKETSLEECETEIPDEEEVEMACGDTEKLAKVEEKLAEAEDKISKYEVELSELKEFKSQIETVKCQEIIDNTLSIAKKVVDETKYSELEVESKECVYASVEKWSDKVLASVSKMAIAKMEEVKLSAKEDDVVDMGMPIPTEQTKTSIYD